MTGFGDYVRMARSTRAETNVRFSLRWVAQRIAVELAYLSKVERGLVAPPSEATIIRLATDLSEDPDVLAKQAQVPPRRQVPVVSRKTLLTEV